MSAGRRREDAEMELQPRPQRQGGAQAQRRMSWAQRPSKDYWKAVFEEHDLDRDGRMSLHELVTLVGRAEYKRDISPSTLQEIMRRADTDGSGYIEEEEFVVMVTHHEWREVFGHLVERYVHYIVPPRQHPDVTDRAAGPYGVSVTDGPYEEQYRCWPPPLGLVLLAVLQLLLFVLDAAVEHLEARGPVATVLIYNPSRRREAWRFLTYMLVHVGWQHLVVNLFVQVLLGVPLEMVHRWWRVLLVYLSGVVAGSLGTSVADPAVLLAGASGGVYALITAHVATILLNWGEMEFPALQLLVFVLLAVLDVGTAVYQRYWLQLTTSIGYTAHTAGALAGLLVGIGVLRNLERHRWERVLWWAAVLLYCMLMLAALLVHLLLPQHFLAEMRP